MNALLAKHEEQRRDLKKKKYLRDLSKGNQRKWVLLPHDGKSSDHSR
jgi:hypothetical protein